MLSQFNFNYANGEQENLTLGATEIRGGLLATFPTYQLDTLGDDEFTWDAMVNLDREDVGHCYTSRGDRTLDFSDA